MSSLQIKYLIKWWDYHPEYDEEFKPGDVMPYYDIYNNGKIILYIKQRIKKRKWLFFPYIEEKIVRVSDSKIKVIITEIPVRRECGE